MPRRCWLLLPPTLAALAGCLPGETKTTAVSGGPLAAPPATSSALTRVGHAPASEEAGLKVAEVGRKVVAANPGLGFRPIFSTVGVAPQEEVFHRGEAEVVITEKLARRCQTEGQLAAVLAHELGRMASERAALAAAAPDRGPPADVPVGKDSGGAFGAPDGVHLAELAKYEQKRKAREAPAAPPNPAALARAYLKKAGYDPADLDAVAPLLHAAEQHAALEKQMTAPPAR
jgi:hypothetical protein